MKPYSDLSFPARSPLLAPASKMRRLLPRRAGLSPRGFFHSAPGLPSPDALGRSGNLEVRLAATRKDLHRAQKLRYRVFYKELCAQANAVTRVRRRDVDAYDSICDHLLVLNHNATERCKPKVVGTYRLLRQDIARQNSGFYSQSEFDIEDLIARQPASLRFMELGRSCVLKPYRTKRILELLWQGIWAYAQRHEIDALFGCASFSGTNLNDHALGLSFLHHYARSSGNWRLSAHPRLHQDMDLIERSAINPKTAMRALPPLIKGYLRVGAKIGDGAVIDPQFDTIDVAVVMPIAKIDQRYLNHFGARA